MGNSGGGLGDYWDKFWSNEFPRLQGGFIWDWVDQGLVLGEKSSGCYGYGGDFGDIPNSKQFCVNGILGPDRAPHPIALEAAALQSPIAIRGEVSRQVNVLQLVITSRRSFVALDDVTLSLSLGCSYVSFTTSTSSAVAVCPSLTVHLKDYPTLYPRTEGKIDLTDPQSGDVLFMLVTSLVVQLGRNARACFTSVETECWLEVTAMSNGGMLVPIEHELAHVTLQPEGLFSLLSHIAAPLITDNMERVGNNSFSNNPRVYKVSHSINPVTGDISVVWGATAGRAVVGGACGRLVHYTPCGVDFFSDDVMVGTSGHGSGKRDGRNILTTPLDLCVYRAPTDNDKGGDVMSYEKQWLAAGYHCLVRKEGSVRVDVVQGEGEPSEEGTAIIVQASWLLVPSEDVIMTNNGLECSIRYTFRSSGHMDLSFSTKVPTNLPPVPRVGVRTSLDRQFDQVEWLGLGPHEAYDDRKVCMTRYCYSSLFQIISVYVETNFICLGNGVS